MWVSTLPPKESEVIHSSHKTSTAGTKHATFPEREPTPPGRQDTSTKILGQSFWVPPVEHSSNQQNYSWKIKWQNKPGNICLDNTTGRCGPRSFLSQPKTTFPILLTVFTSSKCSCCNKYSPPTPSSTCTALSTIWRQDKILLYGDFSIGSGDGKWDPKCKDHSLNLWWHF